MCCTSAWVEGQGGPGRREYELTRDGRARLDRDLAAWRELTETLTGMGTGAIRNG